VVCICVFLITNRAKQRVMLVFDGIDTISSVSLNGVVLGETDNMFRQYVRSKRTVAKNKIE